MITCDHTDSYLGPAGEIKHVPCERIAVATIADINLCSAHWAALVTAE